MYYIFYHLYINMNMYIHMYKEFPTSAARGLYATSPLLCITYGQSPSIDFSFRLSSYARAFIFSFLPRQQSDVTPNESQQPA